MIQTNLDGDVEMTCLMSLFLIKDNCREVVDPIQHPDIWNAYKVHENAFWKAEELHFRRRYGPDWEKLNEIGDRR